jgi:pimeloyl-ACP methyl ester carboxylesterase
MRAVLLPGLDGTGDLFSPLEEALNGRLPTTRVRYPKDEPLGYDALLAHVPQLQEPHILVAESFSGPLAILHAHQEERRAQMQRTSPTFLRGLVLVATFTQSPHAWLRAIPNSWTLHAFRLRPPNAILRAFLLGINASTAATNALAETIASVRSEVLAARLREVRDVDVRPEWDALRLPVLSLFAHGDRLVSPSASLLARPTLFLDGPHLLLQENATEAADAIVRFAAETS